MAATEGALGDGGWSLVEETVRECPSFRFAAQKA